jgi:hypothetical protein
MHGKQGSPESLENLESFGLPKNAYDCLKMLRNA